MAHTSEYRWREVADTATNVAKVVVDALLDAKSKYDDLLELYTYCGSTAQGLADQLFLEDWQARSTQGDNAIVSIDVAGGVLTAVTINDGGSGYVDGTDYLYGVPGGAGDAVIRYDVVAGAVTNATIDNAGTTYTDGLGQNLPNFPSAGLIPDTQASAEEVAKAQDLIDAMTAVNDLYDAADNMVVPQEDRFTQIRRFT